MSNFRSVCSLAWLDTKQIAPYSYLTFENYRRRCIEESSEGTLFLGATAKNGLPIGLAILGNKSPDSSIELLSISIAKSFRGRGIASYMMGEILNKLKQYEYNTVHCSFVKNPSDQSFEFLLSNHGWSSPSPLFDLHFVDSQKYLSSLGTKSSKDLLGNGTVVQLEKLTDKEKSRIQLVAENTLEKEWLWSLDINNPQNFATEKIWFAFAPDGDVIGWIIASYHRANSVSYPILFIREKFRRNTFGIGLVVYGFEKQIESGIKMASACIRCDNQKMLTLISQRMEFAVVERKKLFSSNLSLQCDAAKLSSVDFCHP